MADLDPNTPHSQLDLGYRFHIANQPNAIGYPSLGIVLHKAPTDHFFDPRQVAVPVTPSQVSPNPIERLVISYDWHGQSHYDVCAGRVVLTDRQDDTVEAFTFGGDLDIHPSEDYTTATISSSAPILDLGHGQPSPSLSLLLTAEVEVEMAARRAYWSSHKPGEFERRLSVLSDSPVQLYQACLLKLNDKFAIDSHVEGDAMWQFSHLVHNEARRIRQETGEDAAPKLEEIL
jgi:hypothetical protein